MLFHVSTPQGLAALFHSLAPILHMGRNNISSQPVCTGLLAGSHTLQPTIERYIVGFATGGATSLTGALSVRYWFYDSLGLSTVTRKGVCNRLAKPVGAYCCVWLTLDAFQCRLRYFQD